jgi:hypothetical protein
MFGDGSVDIVRMPVPAASRHALNLPLHGL